MACDCFGSAAANMRLPGLAIEAMRRLERGGGAMMERAFSGFAALPPPPIGRSPASGPDAQVQDVERAFRRNATPLPPAPCL